MRQLPARRAGFSMIEVLLVVLLLGVMALAMQPALTAAEPPQVDLVAEEVASALRLARSEAMRTGMPHAVRVDPASDEVDLFLADLSGGGVAVLQYAVHPLRKHPFRLVTHEVGGSRAVEVLNATAPFDFVGLGRRTVVAFEADGRPRHVDGGTRYRLQSGSVEVGRGGFTRQVTLSPVGRITVK